MRRRARADDNQPQIVAALRKHGASVLHMHVIGKGAPDILVGHQGVNVPVEIKDGSKPPSAQNLTPDETAWHSDWRGSVAIIRSEADARALIDRMASDALLLAAGGS